MPWFEFLSALGLGVAIVYGFAQRRRALRDRLRPQTLDDAAVDRIIQEGELRVDEPEPLDLDEIEEAEREFWQNESWDPAEEERF